MISACFLSTSRISVGSVTILNTTSLDTDLVFRLCVGVVREYEVKLSVARSSSCPATVVGSVS